MHYMARKWTKDEERKYHSQLVRLYVKQNKTIREISSILHIAPSSVYIRLKRLRVPICREKKRDYNNQRTSVSIPRKYTSDLAEFFGVMLGDGHLSYFQVVVTLGTKELAYVKHVAALIKKIFGVKPKISVRKGGYRDVYLGSVEITQWLFARGLVNNKVAAQVDIPAWIFANKKFLKKFVRGFFDTDGSVYRLRHGIQLSFTNRSLPLLKSLHRALVRLGYKPSRISGYVIYVTRKPEIVRFFSEIRPANEKHRGRYLEIIRS